MLITYFFDNSDKNKIPIVKLIDLDLTNNSKNYDELNSILINNNDKNINNDGFIKCMNNLIKTLKNLRE